MTKGVRITLWILSGLAILWTVAAVSIEGTMMLDGTWPICGGMEMGGSWMAARGAGGGGTMAGMMWMVVVMGLTWLVMLRLDPVFITTARGRRSAVNREASTL